MASYSVYKVRGFLPLEVGLGDLFCRVVVQTPMNLSMEQRALLQSFDESLAGKSKHSPRSDNWFNGVTKFFNNLIGGR